MLLRKYIPADTAITISGPCSVEPTSVIASNTETVVGATDITVATALSAAAMPGDTCQIEYDSPPPGRLGHSGVLWGSKMIIFGGGKWTNSTNSTDKFNDVWQLELTNNTSVFY